MDDNETLKLRAELLALTAERDAAVTALEQYSLETEQQTRLLIEEQDRFVSRLLGSQEREVGRLRLELEEAQTTAQLMEQKLDRERAALARLEEDLTYARSQAERLRSQRDDAREDLKRAQQAQVIAEANAERLRGDMALARSMLEDAMSGKLGPGTWESVRPEPSSPDPNAPPRESGFRRPRRSTPPGTRRSEAPRAAAGTSSKDSRPPR
jgi:hypothetical protein